MNGLRMLTIVTVTALASALGASAMPAQDKYTLKVPVGLAFSEFRGYEAGRSVSMSKDEKLIAVILGNPLMSTPTWPDSGQRQTCPRGAKMAKIHWTPEAE